MNTHHPYRRQQPSAKASAIWCLSSALAVILFASHLLGGPDDTQAAIDQAANAQDIEAALRARPDLLQALQDARPGTAQHRTAAAAFCRHGKGPSAKLMQLPDGTLVCRSNKALVMAQSGTAL